MCHRHVLWRTYGNIRIFVFNRTVRSVGEISHKTLSTARIGVVGGVLEGSDFFLRWPAARSANKITRDRGSNRWPCCATHCRLLRRSPPPPTPCKKREKPSRRVKTIENTRRYHLSWPNKIWLFRVITYFAIRVFTVFYFRVYNVTYYILIHVHVSSGLAKYFEQNNSNIVLETFKSILYSRNITNRFCETLIPIFNVRQEKFTEILNSK